MQASTKLNSMQQYMLRVFDRKLNEKQEIEIKRLLSKYFENLVEEEMGQIWEEKKMTQKDLDIALSTHFRTPYKNQN